MAYVPEAEGSGKLGSGRRSASGTGASGRMEEKRTHGVAPAGGLTGLSGGGKCQVERKMHC